MSIRANLAHAKYTLKHKWYVFLGCWHAANTSGDLSLVWRGITHDLSKFSKAEWGAYVHNFFNADGSRKPKQRATGGYDPKDQPLDFKYAFLNHQKVNKHHWQAWCSLGDSGSLDPLPIPETYLWEMVADWYGAGRALGTLGEDGPATWYRNNEHTLILHPETKKKLNDILFKFWKRARKS